MAKKEISKEIKLKFNRLASQMLPKASYSKALVINAGDGLACQYLNYLGVPEVLGIERNSALRQSTQLKLPNMLFFESLSQLDEQHFDLIIVLDKMDFLEHAFENQVFEKISKDCGYIVADLFTYDSMTESVFKAFNLSATEMMSMPTTKKLIDQFSEHIERRIYQEPTHLKNIVRSIWHFRKRLPYAVVLAQSSWSGKTTAARYLFPDLTHISLDQALVKIKRNELPVSDEILKIIHTPALWKNKKIYQVFAEYGCYLDFVKAALASIKELSHKGIIVDGFVPSEHVEHLHQILSDSGYYVVEISLTNAMKPDAGYSYQQVQKFYDDF